MDLLRELRDHWNDSYWWLDHQGLRVVLLSLLSGFLGLGFLYLEIKLKGKMRDVSDS